MIPKIIHQIWGLRDACMPSKYADASRTWIDKHPSWEYRLWTADNLPGMANRHIYDQMTSHASKSDILRYEILYQFGGWYADIDTLCLKPLDALLDKLDIALVRESPTVDGDLIANCFMGCSRYNQFFKRLLAEIPYHAFNTDWPIVGATGPGFLSHFAHELKVPVELKHEQFLPYMWNEKHRALDQFPDAYAVHFWDATWQ